MLYEVITKVPPHSLEAEQAVLASVLLNNDLMNDVVEILRPDDFYQGAHRTLFSTMVDLYERGRAIDQLTLSEAVITSYSIHYTKLYEKIRAGACRSGVT